MNQEQFSTWLERNNQASPKTSLEKPLIMGILNVTSDSFSDGGAFLPLDRACKHAGKLIADGADLIDVGGESTKPGAAQVPLDTELSRVIPVIKYIRNSSDVCISVDTSKPEVMEAAVLAGAHMINDVCALRKEGALAMAAKLQVPVCLMHMQGNPQNMQENPYYPDGVVADIRQFFAERIDACENAGIAKIKLILDPGFGFGKRINDNLHIMHHLQDFQELNVPLLLGVSRKSTIGSLLFKEAGERLIGSIALSVYAALNGVRILRTHDVDETNQALHLIDAVCKAG